MDKFMGMDKFCEHETLTYGKILLGMRCWFMENFCGYDFGCENLLVVHRQVGNYLLAILVM